MSKKDGLRAAPGGAARPDDRLAVVNAAIARLATEDQALALVDTLTRRALEDRLRLGGALARLRDKRWFGGFASFARLVEFRFGLKKSSAYAAIALHQVVSELGLAWERIKDIAPTKLSLLCAKLAAGALTREEFSERLDHARVMSFRELAARLPAAAKSPPYAIRAYRHRGEDDAIMWMRVHGAERVLSFFRKAFPTWRPLDVIAAIWRDTRAAPAASAADNAWPRPAETSG